MGYGVDRVERRGSSGRRDALPNGFEDLVLLRGRKNRQLNDQNVDHRRVEVEYVLEVLLLELEFF
jgi:hypothetical protein